MPRGLSRDDDRGCGSNRGSEPKTQEIPSFQRQCPVPASDCGREARNRISGRFASACVRGTSLAITSRLVP